MTVKSLVKINNIITGSNDITLTNLNVKPYGFNKMYMDKDLIEDKLYQMINQFIEKNYNCKVLFNTFKRNTPIL